LAIEDEACGVAQTAGNLLRRADRDRARLVDKATPLL
jgi:hypothetical protein